MAELEQLIEQCTAQEREQILFAVFYVAFSDGRFWREKPLLDRIRRELDVSAKTAGQLHNRAAGRRPKLTVPERQTARQLSYHYALEIAASDGKLHTRERQVAERLGDHLALSKEEVAAELDALDAAEESKRRRRHRSRRERAGDIQPNNLAALLAGLVGRESEAAAPVRAYLKSPHAIAAVLANLVPVFGVVLFGWEMFDILFLYWLEAVVYGLITIPKLVLMFLFHPEVRAERLSNKEQRFVHCLAIAMWLLIYFTGLFAFLCALLGLFGPGEDNRFSFGELRVVWSPVMVVALAAMVVQYGFLFFHDYVGKRKYLAVNPRMVFFQPLAWTWVLSWVVIVGGIVLENTTFLPRVLFVVFIALKTGLDLLLTYRNPMLFSR